METKILTEEVLDYGDTYLEILPGRANISLFTEDLWKINFLWEIKKLNLQKTGLFGIVHTYIAVLYFPNETRLAKFLDLFLNCFKILDSNTDL